MECLEELKIEVKNELDGVWLTLERFRPDEGGLIYFDAVLVPQPRWRLSVSVGSYLYLQGLRQFVADLERLRKGDVMSIELPPSPHFGLTFTAKEDLAETIVAEAGFHYPYAQWREKKRSREKRYWPEINRLSRDPHF